MFLYWIAVANPKNYRFKIVCQGMPSTQFFQKMAELELVKRFKGLTGDDFSYAAIAKIENLPLVACNHIFDKYDHEIQIINPLREPEAGY
jgi:hypothetical protein